MYTKHFKILVLALSIATLSIFGCHETRQDSYLKAHPELSCVTADNIKEGKVVLGMSKDETIAAWGDPRVIDYDRKGEIWKYEFSGAQGVWVRGIRFLHERVSSIESDFIPVTRVRTWDKFTPRDVRIRD